MITIAYIWLLLDIVYKAVQHKHYHYNPNNRRVCGKKKVLLFHVPDNPIHHLPCRKIRMAYNVKIFQK